MYSDAVLEYELAVLDTSTSTTLSKIMTSENRYRVEHLSSATRLAFQVRARDLRHGGAGWSTSGSVKATLNTPAMTLAAPEPPSVDVTADTGCSAIQILLPPLRQDCEAETSLVLQYRMVGDIDWAAYLQQGLTTQRLVVKVTNPAAAYEFRLNSRRGELSSPPSTALGPVTACGSATGDAGIGYGTDNTPLTGFTVVTAFAIVLILCGVSCCYLFWTMVREAPASKQLPVLYDDQESPVGLSPDGEITVHYDIDGAMQSGVLPLEEVTTLEDLLEELAEFGMELIEGTDIDAQEIEVHYEEPDGKLKKLSHRTAMSVVLASDSLTVTAKGEGKSALLGGSNRSKRKKGRGSEQ